MKIFISWSGDRARGVATALREFIPSVFQRAQVFSTVDDIEKGGRWLPELVQAVDTADFALICITPESLNSPWVTFEAGAVSKAIGIQRLVPDLIDLSPVDLSGPLAQFQTCSIDKSDIFRLLTSINEDSEGTVPYTVFNRIFETLWPDLEHKLRLIAAHPVSPEVVAVTNQSSDLASLEHVRQQIEELWRQVAALLTEKEKRSANAPPDARGEGEV